ncbi:MAG: c-type cytochrome [Alphaproteobacteria bacterium]|nr:MAG: c-type cytochrome [Alphaproteobacteria bacterium]
MKFRLSIALCILAAFFFGTAFAGPAQQSSPQDARRMPTGDSVVPDTVSQALLERGEKLYVRRCGGCHSLDRNRTGPRHRGVYGRKAGSVADFRYSKALQLLNLIWTAETLDRWLENPAAVARGTSMGFRLGKADERKAVIAYLKSLSDTAERQGKN